MKQMGRDKRTYDARKRQCEGKGRLLDVHLHFKINAEVLVVVKTFLQLFHLPRAEQFVQDPDLIFFSHVHVCMRCWYAKI